MLPEEGLELVSLRVFEALCKVVYVEHVGRKLLCANADRKIWFLWDWGEEYQAFRLSSGGALGQATLLVSGVRTPESGNGMPDGAAWLRNGEQMAVARQAPPTAKDASG